MKVNQGGMKYVPVVFLDVVKVIPPDDGGPVHLQLSHHTGEDTATDGHLKMATMNLQSDYIYYWLSDSAI